MKAHKKQVSFFRVYLISTFRNFNVQRYTTRQPWPAPITAIFQSVSAAVWSHSVAYGVPGANVGALPKNRGWKLSSFRTFFGYSRSKQNQKCFRTFGNCSTMINCRFSSQKIWIFDLCRVSETRCFESVRLKRKEIGNEIKMMFL